MVNEANSFEPLVARNGHELVCIIVSRTSARDQCRRSLDDQIAQCKAFVASQYSGNIRYIETEIEHSAGQAEHEQIRELVGQMECQSADLIVAVNLSRISRSALAYRFCRRCVDFQARVITLDDHIDTAVRGWQNGLLQKDPDAEPIVREIFRRFTNGESCAEVADWLNKSPKYRPPS